MAFTWLTGFTVDGSVGIGVGSNPAKQLEILYPSYIDKDTVEGVIRLVGQTTVENSGTNVFSGGVGIEFYNKWQGGLPYSTGRISARTSPGYDGGLQFDVSQNTAAGQTNFITAMTILDNSAVELTNDLIVGGNITTPGNANLGSSNYLRFTAAASGSDASVLFGDTAGTSGSLTFKRNSDTASILTLNGNQSATFTGNVLINGTVIGTDQTYGGAYRTFAFGNNADGSNRIFASNTNSDGMYFAAATGKGFLFRPNGGTTNTFIISSTGDANFTSFTEAAGGFRVPYIVASDAPMITLNGAATGYGIFYRESSPDSIVFKDNGSTKHTFEGDGDFTHVGKGTSAATIASDGVTTLTTKSYVDGLVTGVPVYKGTWAAGTTGVTSAAISGTVITLTAAPTNTIAVGDIVTADGITGITTLVTVVTSQTSITVSSSVTIATAITVTFSPVGGFPDLTVADLKILGNYYIVDTAGYATPNGASVEPDSWNVGDWAIFSDITPGAGTDLWQKIDNTSVISGAGTGGKITKWAGASGANSETLTDSIISENLSTVTIDNNPGNLIVTGTVGAAEFDLPSSGSLDWANGDARIQEGLVSNYSLSFQTYTGSALTTKMFIASGGNIGIGITNPTGKLFVGSSWPTTYGGTDLYVTQTSGKVNYDPSIQNTSALGITYSAEDSNTSGPGAVGITLYNNDTTVGGFSPMLIFAKRESGATSYKASQAAIYARSPLGTGNGDSWIDGELIFATSGASSTGLAQRMVLNKEGFLGIGTTAPETSLHVFKGESGGAAANTSSAITIEHNDHTYLQFLTPATKESGILFGDTDNDRGAFTYSQSADAMNFRVAASTRLTINSTSATFTGDINLGGKQTFTGDGATRYGDPAAFGVASNGDKIIAYNNSSYDGRIGVGDASNLWLKSYGSAANVGDIDFYTGGHFSAILKGTGKMGIGTATPNSTLQVGDYLDDFANAITISSRYQHTPQIDFNLGNPDAAAPGGAWEWTGATIQGADDGSYNGRLEFYTAPGSGRLTPDLKMVIKSTGKVGIATSAPGNFLTLGVNDSTHNDIEVRYSSVPIYMSGGYDGSSVTNQISTNYKDTSVGSESFTNLDNVTFGGLTYRQAASTTTGSKHSWTYAPPTGSNIQPTPAEQMSLIATGRFRLNNYGSQTFTGTSASYLIADSNGNVQEKTPAQVLTDIGGAPATGGSYLPLIGGTMTGTISSTYDGINSYMDGGVSAEGIRMQADSATTYPTFLRSVNPPSGESSPWIYKEAAAPWGIWHNNPINSYDITRATIAGSIEDNVGGGTNSVMIRLNSTDGAGTFAGPLTATSATFTNKATSALTVAADSSATLTTKSYVDSENGGAYFKQGVKTVTISTTYATVLTASLSNHTSCYVTVCCFGDWGGHSAAAYRGEFFLQNGTNTYAEPGIILRQDDNTSNGLDQILCQIVDNSSTANPKDFVIQMKHTDPSAPATFNGTITYTVQGQFNSAS